MKIFGVNKYFLYRLWDKVAIIPDQIKWFIQRGTRGWADCDAWGYFCYNARVNKEVLMWLREHKHGTPCSMFDIREARNPTEYEEKEGQEKWDAILSDMIYAFDEILRDEKAEILRWFPKRNIKNYEDFLKRYPDTHVQTRDEARRMARGMKLFIKHYESLWD